MLSEEQKRFKALSITEKMDEILHNQEKERAVLKLCVENLTLLKKKQRASMMIIFKMITLYQENGGRNEEIFKFFDTAKGIDFAKDEEDFQRAAKCLGSPKI